jgi:SAM-dependent methyltransferase
MALTLLLAPFKLPSDLQIKNLDDPDNILIIREIIRRKRFLVETYKSFYRDLLAKSGGVFSDKRVIELGSGASFLKRLNPHVITSDILPYEGVDCVFSGMEMPMNDGSIDAFLMIDVLHHIKDSRIFLREASRCLKLGGKIVMIEPANTVWSRIIYRSFHHEPFETSGDWGFEEGGPISGANMAIPWIIFCRDRDVFRQEFSQFRICSITTHTPLRYLISGGLSLRQLLPSFMYPVVRFIEKLLTPLNRYIGLFMTIELEKIDGGL